MASSINKFFLITLLLSCSLIPTYFYCMSLKDDIENMSVSEEEAKILLIAWETKVLQIENIIQHAKKNHILQKQITLAPMVFNEVNITDIKAQFDFINQTVLLQANHLKTVMEIKSFLNKLSGGTISCKKRCHNKCSIQ